MSLKSYLSKHLRPACIWTKSNERIFKVFGLIFAAVAFTIGIAWAFGADVEPITFLLAFLSSAMFGSVELAHYLVPDRKAVRDMSIDEMLILLEESPSRSAWKVITTNVACEAVLKEDPRLRLAIRYDEAGTQCENFGERWATGFPDPNATGYWVDISYDRALIEREILVSVDGGRAMLPIPESSTDLVATRRRYVIASLFDALGNLDDYMRRSGLRVG